MTNNGERLSPRQPYSTMPKEPKKDGRGGHQYDKLTEETQEKIFKAMRMGMHPEGAAALAGIHKQTLYEWIKRGRRHKSGKHVEFLEKLEVALADFEHSRLEIIDGHSDAVWQAAAWRLERRFPEKYGIRHRVDGTVKVQAAPFVDYAKLDAHDMAELERILEKGAPDVDALPKNGRPALELMPGVIEGEVVAES